MTGTRRAVSRSLGILAVTLSLASWSSGARADGDEAVTRFERGVQLYETENYEGALVEFNTAYKLSSNYKLLYNIAICQTALKDYATATGTFNKYLSEGGAEVSETRRAEVRDRLSKLALNVTRVRIATDAPAGSALTVDDQPLATTPVDAVLVKIGRRQFSMTSNGRTITKMVDLSSGDQNPPINFSFASLPRQTDNKTTTTPSQAAVPNFPYAWWGLTVLLGAGTAVTGTIAVGKRNDFENDQASFGVTKKTLTDDRSSAQTLGIVTDALLAGTVISAGLSTYFTIDYFKKKKQQQNTGFYVLPLGLGYARSF